MLTLTCCQDHILTENIWFVWSKTSNCGNKWRCYRCGTNEQTLKIELLSQWKLEAEFRKKMAETEKYGLENHGNTFVNIWEINHRSQVTSGIITHGPEGNATAATCDEKSSTVTPTHPSIWCHPSMCEEQNIFVLTVKLICLKYKHTFVWNRNCICPNC